MLRQKEWGNQATLASPRYPTQIERIKSQFEVLTEELTRFFTSVNRTLLATKDTRRGRGLREVEGREEICDKTISKDKVKCASLSHHIIYLPKCQIHSEGSPFELETKIEDSRSHFGVWSLNWKPKTMTKYHGPVQSHEPMTWRGL